LPRGGGVPRGQHGAEDPGGHGIHRARGRTGHHHIARSSRGRHGRPHGHPRGRRLSVDINLAVNGTLMRGLELNANMLSAGAPFVREARTVPAYRLWSIGDRHPAMIRVASGGVSVAVEVWAVPPDGLAKILRQEPPGLCIGKVTLSDGEEVLGVLGEPLLCEGQREISQHGGWRAYVASRKTGEDNPAEGAWRLGGGVGGGMV